MTCAGHLKTFLLICLFQAEHVRCLWATQAQGSQRQSGNAYVGFLRQDSGLRRDGGSKPQNMFRQASVSPRSSQSRGLNPEPVSSGYDRGVSSGGYTPMDSQQAPSGYASVKLVDSSSVSNPNWKTTDSKRVNVQSVRKTLSSSIASGSALSQYSQIQNRLSDRTRPTQQGTQRINQHLSRNSASARSPTFSAQAGHPPSSQKSSMFKAGAPVPEHSSVRGHTSASVRAQRVTPKSKAAASKPSSFSVPQNERIRNDPSQTDRFRSKMFTLTGGSAQGDYAPASSMASSYHQSAFAPRSPGGSQGSNYGPSYNSAETPSQSRPALSQNNRNQREGGLRATGRSSQQFAPTRTHSIPNRFGGSPIRRLRVSTDQKQVVQTPKLKYTAPSRQTASYNPQGQSVHTEIKLKRVSRLHQ